MKRNRHTAAREEKRREKARVEAATRANGSAAGLRLGDTYAANCSA